VVEQQLALANKLDIMDNSSVNQPKDKLAGPPVGVSGDSTLTDLIARSRAGDPRAMEAIYHRFKTGLFNLAYRYTYERTAAEDLLQDIFLKIFTHLDDVQKMETFVGWIYRIALNTCYSYLRGKRVELQKTVSLNEVEGTVHEAEQSSRGEELRKPLDDAIARLPHRLREIFLMHDVQGFKHEEIARMLSLAVGTSKSQLFKARLKMRDFLKEKNIYQGEMR